MEKRVWKKSNIGRIVHYDLNIETQQLIKKNLFLDVLIQETKVNFLQIVEVCKSERV